MQSLSAKTKFQSLKRELQQCKKKSRDLSPLHHGSSCSGDTDSAQNYVLEKHSDLSFFSLRTQYAATIAAQTLLHSEATHKFKAYPAPGPEEMNWHALCKSWIEKDIRSILVFPFLAFMCLLPIGLAMGAMSKLNDFLCSDFEADWYWPAYCRTDGTSGTNRLRSLVTGWLPSIVVAIWQNVVMPKTLYYLLQVKMCIHSPLTNFIFSTLSSWRFVFGRISVILMICYLLLCVP